MKTDLFQSLLHYCFIIKGYVRGVCNFFLLSHHRKDLKQCYKQCYSVTVLQLGYSSVLFGKQRIVHARGMMVGLPQRRGLNLSWLHLIISFVSTHPEPAL